jgi:hypothetical protein
MGVIILMAICLAFVFVDKLSIPQRWDGYLDFKPFNCSTCMAGWFTLFLMIVWDCPLLGVMFQAAGWMAVAMVVSIFLNFTINKL